LICDRDTLSSHRRDSFTFYTMGSIEEPSFSAPAETLSVNGLLFDFDGKANNQPLLYPSLTLSGTLVDSTAAIVKHWHLLGKELGVDPDEILHDSHGRRSIDTLRLYDESKANWDCTTPGVGCEAGKYALITLQILVR
jgi:glycerol-1-phosphatase